MKITLEDCILEHIKRYPEMEIQDVVKIVFQSEFGGGHMIKDPSDSLNRLYREYENIKETQRGLPVYFELIGNRLGRLYLDGIDAHLSLETVNRFFVNTAARVNSDRGSFEKKLDRLRKMAKEGRLPWTAQALEDYLEDYKAKGYHAVSHSQTYRRRYHPSYRVISEDYMTYLKVFEWLDRHLNRTDGRCIIAIDGKCGSGKSYLARLISGVYPCSVIHMDDFFLRPSQKTEERLLEIGGNVDYERFKEEVIDPLSKDAQVFEYQRYDCMQQRLGSSVRCWRKKLTVIEGSYSCHPYFGDNYDLKIFLDLDAKTQEHRILERNGAYMLTRFINEWIPKENQYFDHFGIKEKADMVFM